VLLIGAALLLESLAHLYTASDPGQNDESSNSKSRLPRFRYNTEQKNGIYRNLSGEWNRFPVSAMPAVVAHPSYDRLRETPVQVANRAPLEAQ